MTLNTLLNSLMGRAHLNVSFCVQIKLSQSRNVQ